MKSTLVNVVSTTDNPDLQQLILFFNETLGFCPNSVLTMAHRPEIAKAFIQLNMAVMQNKGKLSSSLKRLIGYISSYTAGCAYCQAHTIRAAERYGAEKEKLENIWNYETHPAFNNAERSALHFARAASIIPNAVTDDIASNLRQYWDEGDIVEITAVVSLFGFLNRWNDSMGTAIEPGAVESGKKYLADNGWTAHKHLY